MNRKSPELSQANSSEPKISRRDWFRLRRGTTAADCLQVDNTADRGQPRQLMAPGQPISQPTNYGEIDLAQLPPLREAELDGEQLVQLFEDLREFAHRISVHYRGLSSGVDQGLVDAATQLIAVRTELFSGRLSRVQIRYAWDGAWWIDTLESRDGRFRLVRICHKIPNMAGSP